MSEPVVLYVTIRAEVADRGRALKATCDRVHTALTEGRGAGEITPSPTSIVVSVEPPREGRRGPRSDDARKRNHKWLADAVFGRRP